MALDKIEKDKSTCILNKLPDSLQSEVSSYLDDSSQEQVALFYCSLFGQQNIFREEQMKRKITQFIASGKLEKIGSLLQICPDLKKDVFTLLKREVFRLAGIGAQDQLEKIVTLYPYLLLEYAPLEDISGIKPTIYGKNGITLFQHALWSGDVFYMGTMLLNCLPKNEQGEALRMALMSQYVELMHKGVLYECNEELRHERQFSLQPLINTLCHYVENYPRWSWAQRKIYWCSQLGSIQRTLPAHLRQHYCDPEESFQPVPTFRKKRFTRRLEFYNAAEEQIDVWNQSVNKLGVHFAISRGNWQRKAYGSGGWCGSSLENAQLDLAALVAFAAIRAQDLERLHKKLQPQEELFNHKLDAK